MQILPAIDLRGGQCVRLRQGDYARETVFGNNPAQMAKRWAEEGAPWLHLVDLDGAKEGQPVNGQSIQSIVDAIDIPCELGGGIRTEGHIEEVLSWGVHRVILGTKAIQSPEWCQQICEQFPNKIVIGIDARDGQVATEGWLKGSGKSALELARECAQWPLAAIVYTDISRDGMMEGPNFNALDELIQQVPVPIIASGGVTTLEDVRALAQRKVEGCIIGRALYEGQIRLSDALKIASNAGCEHQEDSE